VELLSGRLGHDSEQLRHEVRQLTVHLDQINDSLRYLADTPARRRAEARRRAWARFKRRQMPPGPPSVACLPIGTRIRQAPEPTRQIGGVDRYNGEQFEQYVAELLCRAGWPEVEVVGAGTATPGKGDHGVDILAVDGDVTLAVSASGTPPGIGSGRRNCASSAAGRCTTRPRRWHSSPPRMSPTPPDSSPSTATTAGSRRSCW
jgi:hypothetical protein